MLKVSPRSVETATKVLKVADETTIGAVEAGELAVSAAVPVAHSNTSAGRADESEPLHSFNSAKVSGSQPTLGELATKVNESIIKIHDSIKFLAAHYYDAIVDLQATSQWDDADKQLAIQYCDLIVKGYKDTLKAATSLVYQLKKGAHTADKHMKDLENTWKPLLSLLTSEQEKESQPDATEQELEP